MLPIPYVGMALSAVNTVADTFNDVAGIGHKLMDTNFKHKTLNYEKYMLSNAMTQNYLGTTALVGLKKNGAMGISINTKNIQEKLYWALISAKQMK